MSSNAQTGELTDSSGTLSGSQLTKQLQQKMTGLKETTGPETPAASLSPTKARSLSEASSRTPSSVSPNPSSIQRTKDDIAVTAAPATPHRPDRLTHGLSLQMPSRMFGSPIAAGNRVPLSPKLDSSHIYGSPASVLPRRSRGLDFSRACTNLHHSTLAESSPDSSPVVLGRGVAIPNRRSNTNSAGMGSPGMPGGSTWQSIGNSDRAVISSSVSSVNMFESDTTSSSDGDEDDSMHIIDREDPILMTPHLSRPGNAFSTPFSPSTAQSPGGDWMSGLSAAKASLMSFQRARLRGARSRHSSSSTSGNSSKPSPGPISPPVFKSIESAATGYFPREMSMSEVKSRRESLSLGTSDLHLSDMSDDDNRLARFDSPSSSAPLPGTTNIESGPHGVIRRPVTRRGNLLPKTKNFARIRAALLEEVAPIDFECQREAEVIRQVRESEGGELPPLSPSLTSPLDSSDSINPNDARDIVTTRLTGEGSSSSIFTSHPSSGIGRLSAFNNRYQTPPPPTTQPTGPFTSTSTSDTTMRTPPSASPGVLANQHTSNNAPQPSAIAGPSRIEAEASRTNKKRRHDEMIDMNAFKRRAVSPGMYVQNCPVAASQPSSSGSSASYLSKKLSKELSSRAEGDAQTQLQSKNPLTSTSTPTTGKTGRVTEGSTMKRVGMQGMKETNDGLMNMSID
ncbi:enoyl-CoA hydratase [Histoplasma ohiense]|nr:enoyl-CoA hydratase [Histoplasma ohiense (nom. inval.)]